VGCEDKKVCSDGCRNAYNNKRNKNTTFYVVERIRERKSYQVKTMVAGEAISKEKLTSDIIKKYISHKTETIQKQFKEINITLIEDEADVERYIKKEKAPKELKKSTVQETYELWLEKNSIKEIAGIRKFTEETILGHLTKLIIAKTIRINDVLPEDKIQELNEAFYGYKEESISPLKEKYGDKFTWEELRMFKASLN
jgi:uncharacterized protein YpbB